MSDALPKAILFDLDNTIIEHEQPNLVWEKISDRYASLISNVSSADLLEAILAKREWYWDNPERHRRGRLNLKRATFNIVNDAFQTLNIDDTVLVQEIAEAYQTHCDTAEQLDAAAIDVLEKLRADDVKLALVTNGAKEPQRSKLARHKIEPYFDAILIEGEYGVGKPDPRVYYHALDMLKVPSKHAWMVGDNLEWEVSTPQRLGLKGIWVNRYGIDFPKDNTVEPYRIISSLSELL